MNTGLDELEESIDDDPLQRVLAGARAADWG